MTLAYVTSRDIQLIGSLGDQTVLVVKAPYETRLELPAMPEVCGPLGSPLLQSVVCGIKRYKMTRYSDARGGGLCCFWCPTQKST